MRCVKLMFVSDGRYRWGIDDVICEFDVHVRWQISMGYWICDMWTWCSCQMADIDGVLMFWMLTWRNPVLRLLGTNLAITKRLLGIPSDATGGNKNSKKVAKAIGGALYGFNTLLQVIPSIEFGTYLRSIGIDAWKASACFILGNMGWRRNQIFYA